MDLNDVYFQTITINWCHHLLKPEENKMIGINSLQGLVLTDMVKISALDCYTRANFCTVNGMAVGRRLPWLPLFVCRILWNMRWPIWVFKNISWYYIKTDTEEETLVWQEPWRRESFVRHEPILKQTPAPTGERLSCHERGGAESIYKNKRWSFLKLRQTKHIHFLSCFLAGITLKRLWVQR